MAEKFGALIHMDGLIIGLLGLIAVALMFVHVPESNEKYLTGIISALCIAFTGRGKGG